MIHSLVASSDFPPMPRNMYLGGLEYQVSQVRTKHMDCCRKLEPSKSKSACADVWIHIFVAGGIKDYIVSEGYVLLG